MATRQAASGTVRAGIGGWTYEPWRDNFYPKGLAHSKELAFASAHLTAIEVNGTYYSTFKPPTFAKWRDETPDGFMFSLKANRFATNRKVLADAGESIERFVGSGLSELGPKLGPLVWQFAPTKLFDPVDFEAFLKLLPAKVDGLPLRHALDVRHESFMDPAYLALARKYRCATVFTDSDDYPLVCRLDGRFRLRAFDANRPEGEDGLCAQGPGPMGRCSEDLGCGRVSPPMCRGWKPPERRPGRVTCSCTSSAVPRNGHPRRRWP